jgi:glycosyltransferase involved in cell wall biosynthesis
MLSIVLTIHNKEFLLEKVIQGILKNTVGDFEIIYVLDGCSDKSEVITNKYLRKNDKLIFSDNVFETKAHNVGMKAAQGEFIAIIQDDQIIDEYSWNLRILRPFSFSDVFAVTSGVAHNWKLTNPSDPCSVDDNEGWSKLLQVTCKASKQTSNRDVFSVRASGNRGPLVVNHENLVDLNYLDEVYAPLDMDDHDLAFRARSQLGKVVGSYWVDVISKLEWGGTRASGETAPWMLEANRKNSRIFVERWETEIESTSSFIDNRTLKDTASFKNRIARLLKVSY